MEKAVSLKMEEGRIIITTSGSWQTIVSRLYLAPHRDGILRGGRLNWLLGRSESQPVTWFLPPRIDFCDPVTKADPVRRKDQEGIG